jgi:hypothetical protein
MNSGCVRTTISHHRNQTENDLSRHRREHLNDDLQVVTLPKELLAAPPVDLWPRVIRRVTVPADVEALLLTELERVQ